MGYHTGGADRGLVKLELQLLRGIDQEGLARLLGLSGQEPTSTETISLVYVTEQDKVRDKVAVTLFGVMSVHGQLHGLFDATELVRPPALSTKLAFTTLTVGDVVAVDFDCRIVGEVDDCCELRFNVLCTYLLVAR